MSDRLNTQYEKKILLFIILVTLYNEYIGTGFRLVSIYKHIYIYIYKRYLNRF